MISRFSILRPPIKNIFNKYMPIVIDNIDNYVLEMKNNSLTITLKSYNFKKDVKKKEELIKKIKEDI
tara:strand:- start:2651 stop:2851 length:201 start_codon:yes stop_codon:yes gene_type:complete